MFMCLCRTVLNLSNVIKRDMSIDIMDIGSNFTVVAEDLDTDTLAEYQKWNPAGPSSPVKASNNEPTPRPLGFR